MKYYKKMAYMVLTIGVVTQLASCEGTPVKLDQPFDTSVEQKYDMSKGRTATARACGFQLFLFIPIVTNQRASFAYRNLKTQAGKGYLTDIRVQETWTYAYVGTLYCTIMEGTIYPPLQS